LIGEFVGWIRGLGIRGYQAPPFEWMTLRG
jgi:hypothetical protein